MVEPGISAGQLLPRIFRFLGIDFRNTLPPGLGGRVFVFNGLPRIFHFSDVHFPIPSPPGFDIILGIWENEFCMRKGDHFKRGLGQSVDWPLPTVTGLGLPPVRSPQTLFEVISLIDNLRGSDCD